jgi:hypothetical protein
MELTPISRTDRGIGRLKAALTIYKSTILPEAQNPERQILYWIDHSKDTLADEFRCFAIQHREVVVGYLQYSYFREEHIFFFEYLCIQGNGQAGLSPSVAVKNIEDYLASNYEPNFTIAFEVARKQGNDGQWKPDRKLIDYFSRIGFRTVDFDYRYPVLQSYEGDTSYPADLMVMLPNKRISIMAVELRTILRCIYFKHYLRWDRPFLEPDSFKRRELLIEQLYSKEVSRIGGNDSFGTRGDDRRSLIDRFKSRSPRIRDLLKKVFGPKLPRLLAVMLVAFVAQWALGSVWYLIPFTLTVAALFCLSEDTATSRKLFLAIVAKFSVARPRSL